MIRQTFKTISNSPKRSKDDIMFQDEEALEQLVDEIQNQRRQQRHQPFKPKEKKSDRAEAAIPRALQTLEETKKQFMD